MPGGDDVRMIFWDYTPKESLDRFEKDYTDYLISNVEFSISNFGKSEGRNVWIDYPDLDMCG
jgi:hypothetical protein